MIFFTICFFLPALQLFVDCLDSASSPSPRLREYITKTLKACGTQLFSLGGGGGEGCKS